MKSIVVTKTKSIQLANSYDCIGCGACASTCPVDCIRMVEDKEGFLQPKVDGKKCIGCHRCEKTCPILNKEPIKKGHADRVIADSYHAMVFTMMFHRPFTFMDRVGRGMGMNSRVQTLIEKFGIPIEQLNAITEIPIDWDVFEQRLEHERKDALLYLENAII